MQQAPEKQELYATNSELEECLGRLVQVDKAKQGVAAMLGIDLAYRALMRGSIKRRVKLVGRLGKHRIRSKLVVAKLAGCRQGHLGTTGIGMEH
jgi:hypothetical protein